MDGSNLIAEYDASGNLLRRYVHGAGIDEPLVWYEGSDTSDRRWLAADERGSVIAATNASGGVVTIYTYDEYGIPGAGNAGRFQYTGQTWIEAVGLYHYKSRFYAPRQGRFLQADRIGYAGGMNLYAYVAGDPVNLIDPFGMEGAPECPDPDGCITVTAARQPSPFNLAWYGSGGAGGTTFGQGGLNAGAYYVHANDRIQQTTEAASDEGRDLSECEKRKLKPYIPQQDLNNARLHVGHVPWYLREEFQAITRGNDIYFRVGHYDPTEVGGLSVLGHELVHVSQYRQGMTWVTYLWSTRNGYFSSHYEKAAYQMQAKIRVELIKQGFQGC